MLHLAATMHQLNFGKLMAVYEQSNRENAELLFPNLPENLHILQAEQSFYQYLTEGFFSVSGAVYAIWTENENYLSALRLEPYEDGLLLEGLETAPAFRKQGYATRLIQAVQQKFPEKIYAHVHKRNKASLAVHQKCGFQILYDYARYIDGSVASNAYTLCYQP